MVSFPQADWDSMISKKYTVAYICQLPLTVPNWTGTTQSHITYKFVSTNYNIDTDRFGFIDEKAVFKIVDKR
jgi:hypothetical protein